MMRIDRMNHDINVGHIADEFRSSDVNEPLKTSHFPYMNKSAERLIHGRIEEIIT